MFERYEFDRFDSFADCVEFVREYSKAFKKARVTADNLWRLNAEDIVIYLVKERREGGHLVRREEERVGARTYANVISAVLFFNDSLHRAYTEAGYIPTRFVARSPYGDESTSRYFKIMRASAEQLEQGRC